MACQKEDREFHGRAYYRRYHQLPGIWWCTKHENAVLHVTPEGEAAYEQPPDFWVKNGSRQVAFQLKTFSKAHQAFLLAYMSLCEGIMTGQLAIEPAKVWAHGFAFAQESEIPIANISHRCPLGVVDRGRLLSDFLALSAPRPWLSQLYPTWRMKRLGTPDYIFDRSRGYSTYCFAVVAAATGGEQLLSEPAQTPKVRPRQKRALIRS
jgi:hypothetical protein